MREWFERGGADETGERVALSETRLRAPIVPKKFFHTAGNFREHEEESKQVGWTHEIAPWIVFFQNVDAIVGPDEPVVYPEHLTEELDYELELAVVLKKAGKWFSPEEAADYIGGYVIFNDITARDIQRREMRSGVFSFCKAIDTFCPLGPWIVTPDEIPDPHDLAMTLRVNGDERQVSHSSRMSVTIPEILSHYSALGYSAGDVLSTGTVSGVAGFSPDAASLYLRPGDVMECEIERIGVLRNPVVSWQDGSRRAAAPTRPMVTRPARTRPAPPPTRVGGLPASLWDRRYRRYVRESVPGACRLCRRVGRELAAGRREARPRARADGRARARRDRRPCARQRPLPDQLLGHEGLRRGRVPARGRPDARLPRGIGRRRGADGVDVRRPPLRRIRPRGSAPAAGACPRDGRSTRRRGYETHRPRAHARHAGVRSHGRRADDLHEGLVRRLSGRGRRDAAARRGARREDGAGDRAHAARERDRGGGHGPRPRRDPTRA